MTKNIPDKMRIQSIMHNRDAKRTKNTLQFMGLGSEAYYYPEYNNHKLFTSYSRAELPN